MSRQALILLLLAPVAIAVPCVCCFIGEVPVRPVHLGQPDSLEYWVLVNYRVPRVLAGLIAGATLGLCGMAFQAIFRNPLTTPYTLGVASGGSLGAVVFISLGLTFSLAGVPGITLFAFLGSLVSVFLIQLLARLRRDASTASLLLAGVALNLCYSSIILFLQFHSNYHDSYRIVRWMMGGLGLPDMNAVFTILPFCFCGVAVTVLHTHELNLLTTGDDLAGSRGVNAAATKRLVFVGCSLAVGGIVAMCGPIGFIGLMAPHICRMMIGVNHRYLGPATALFGGSFLVVCDTLARTLPETTQMPVGVITALLGGPYFLALLCLRRGGRRLIG